MALSAYICPAVDKINPAIPTDALKIMMQVLSCQEIFVAPDAQSCTLFVYSENSNPDKKGIRVKLNSYLKFNIQNDVEITELNEQQAVSCFLQLANGLNNQNRLEQVQSFSENFNRARKEALIGPVLQRLFQRSIWLHEKIRISTSYFKYATEPARIFCELAEKIYGSIAPLKVQINGFDPVVESYLQILYQFGCRKFVFNGNADDLKKLSASLSFSSLISKGNDNPVVDADILLSCASGPLKTDEQQLSQKMARMGNAPFLILNIDSSEDLQIAAQKLFNVYCYNIADLQHIIEKNKQLQKGVLKELQPWIDKEVIDFYSWLSGSERYKFGNIIGHSAKMQQIFEMISRIAQTDISVLIQGASGTGKELISRAIHTMSARADRPFVVVNCGAIPENLLESELFGHLRGSFTGAVADKMGLFFEANQGTILLDEIAEMPLQLQVKLLRFLQEGDLKPVGSNETIHVDVRVLAATNKNLQEMVDKGTFRSDLFYRLNVILLELPVLNERREDIPLLADFFLKKYARKLNKGVHELSETALQKLQDYTWPGNVRELENVIEHAVALALGKQIVPDDFPESVKNIKGSTFKSSSALSANNGFTKIKDVEKLHISRVLDDTSWDYEKACRLLGIGRTTLWRKIKEYDIRQK
jgi:two-component system, NtrC family, response regulator AtoC